MNEEKLKRLYEELGSILDVCSGWLYDNFIRTFLWGIVKLLSWTNNYIESIVNKIVTFNNFYEDSAFGDLLNKAKPLMLGLFLITLIVVGFLLMLNKIEKRNELLINALMAVSILVVIPGLMTSMQQVLGIGVSWMGNDAGTLSGSILKSNTADLKYYVNNNFNIDNSKENGYRGSKGKLPRPIDENDSSVGTTDYTFANQLSNEKATMAINETLDVRQDTGWFAWTTEDWVKKLSDDQEDFLTHQLVPTGVGNKTTVGELEKNSVPGTNLGQQSYYRYHINWGTVIFSLLITTFALFITVIKLGRATFDLAFHQIFGMFIAVTDLTGGQRTKKVLVEIASTFSVMFIMVVILKMFVLYCNWVNSLKPEIGSIGCLLMLIAGAWAVIDAPDIVQRMLGIDAGLRNGWQAAMGAYAASKVGGSVLSGGKKVASGAGKTLGGSAKGIQGAVRGLGSKTPKELKQQGQNGVRPMPSNSNSTGSGQTGDKFAMSPEQTSTPPQNISKDNENANATSKDNNDLENRNQNVIPSRNNENNKGKKAGHTGNTQSNLSTNNKIPSRSANDKSINRGMNVKTDIGSNLSTTSIPSSSPTMDSNNSLGNSVGKSVSSVSTGSTSGVISPKTNTVSGTGIPYGHKEANHKNTILGNNRSIRQAKEFMARAENSGFDVGQRARSVAVTTGQAVSKASSLASRGMIRTARAVSNPIKSAQYVKGSSVQAAANIKKSINQVPNRENHNLGQVSHSVRETPKEVKPSINGESQERGLREREIRNTKRD